MSYMQKTDRKTAIPMQHYSKDLLEQCGTGSTLTVEIVEIKAL